MQIPRTSFLRTGPVRHAFVPNNGPLVRPEKAVPESSLGPDRAAAVDPRVGRARRRQPRANARWQCRRRQHPNPAHSLFLFPPCPVAGVRPLQRPPAAAVVLPPPVNAVTRCSLLAPTCTPRVSPPPRPTGRTMAAGAPAAAAAAHNTTSGPVDLHDGADLPAAVGTPPGGIPAGPPPPPPSSTSTRPARRRAPKSTTSSSRSPPPTSPRRRSASSALRRQTTRS